RRQVPAIGTVGQGVDAAAVPSDVQNFPARRGVPDLHRPTQATAGEAFAVGAEGYAYHGGSVRADLEELLACHIPDPYIPVHAGSSQTAAVGAEGQATDFRGVADELGNLLTSGCIPESHAPVTAGRSQTAAIRAKGHSVDHASMAAQREPLLPGCRVPHLDRLVLASGSE